MSGGLGDSSQEQEMLRVIALWAADCAEGAVALFEERHPGDSRPRDAVEAGREYGRGRKRDKALRIVSLAALRAGKDVDEVSKYAARAATLVASVAYTHTDLQDGLSGVRQARHVLGPAVYAALAVEMAAGGDFEVGDGLIRAAVESAPEEVRRFLGVMPAQPEGKGRLEGLFFELDLGLRR